MAEGSEGELRACRGNGAENSSQSKVWGRRGGNEEMFVAPGRSQRGPRGTRIPESLGAQILKIMSRIKEDLG